MLRCKSPSSPHPIDHGTVLVDFFMKVHLWMNSAWTNGTIAEVHRLVIPQQCCFRLGPIKNIYQHLRMGGFSVFLDPLWLVCLSSVFLCRHYSTAKVEANLHLPGAVKGTLVWRKPQMWGLDKSEWQDKKSPWKDSVTTDSLWLQQYPLSSEFRQVKWSSCYTSLV